MNTSKLKRYFGIVSIAIAMVAAAGQLTAVQAQRDPFQKASWATAKPVSTGVKTANGGKGGPVATVDYGPPMIEARIQYFKELRERAAAGGQPLPKVTSVLLVSELVVNGIFKTPRGYAAMVEATPIKLSYTIYPGEKFFDGQLVAVEENRLVFRRVTKTAPKKFVASVEYKPLRQFTMRSQIEGTAPVQGSDKPVQTASAAPAPGTTQVPAAPAQIISPLDEMNSIPSDQPKDKPKKPAKRPVRVAKNGK